MNKEYVKVTFIGDISCDRPLLNAVRLNGYDFSQVFSAVKELFRKSDYVCANFETVCAGLANEYKDQYMLCNAPDQLVKYMADSGINFVTTANNHCCDGGISGLLRTLQILEYYHIEHDGTFPDRENYEKIFLKHLGSITIAIIAVTYSTNESNIDVLLNQENDYFVRLLREQKLSGSQCKKFILKHISGKNRRRINRIIARTKLKLGLSFLRPRIDTILEGDTDNKYLYKLKEIIEEASKKADYVFVCPHFGGQFNVATGDYAEFLSEFLMKSGASAIVGNHPHVIQRIERNNDGRVCAYSLGGFNQSISADYIVHDYNPEYSLALHFYLPNNGIQKADQASFTILKNIEDETGMLTVYPVCELYTKLDEIEKTHLFEDTKKLYTRITGRDISDFKMQDEYQL